MSLSFSPVAQRTLALGILALTVALVWFLVALPLVLAWSERSDEAVRNEELLARLQAITAEIPTLRAQGAAMAHSQQNQAVSFSATNANLAAVQLQAEVKRIAADDGAVVQSIQQLPPIPESGLDRIGVRAELQGDTGQIAKILRDLDSHAPKLFIRTMSIRGNEQQSVAVSPPSPLFVQIEVTAYSRNGE